MLQGPDFEFIYVLFVQSANLLEAADEFQIKVDLVVKFIMEMLIVKPISKNIEVPHLLQLSHLLQKVLKLLITFELDPIER